MKAIKTAARRKERGNSIVEFALVATFLVPLVAGLFTVGLATVRYQQASQVNRDAGSLYVRGVPMHTDDSKRLLNRLAAGLGLGSTGCSSQDVFDTDNDGNKTEPVPCGSGNYPLPSPNGRGNVYLSEVMHIGEFQCEQGGFAGPSYSGCTNFDQYVFTQRISIGNTALRPSDLGTPVGPFSSEGKISLVNQLTNTGNRASNFKTTPAGSGILYLEKGLFTRVSESFFQLDELSFIVDLGISLNRLDGNSNGVYARNIY